MSRPCDTCTTELSKFWARRAHGQEAGALKVRHDACADCWLARVQHWDTDRSPLFLCVEGARA